MTTEYEIIINQLSREEGKEWEGTEFFKQRVKAINLPDIFGVINHFPVERQQHYRGLFEEIRQAVQPLTPTDATKKEIIDCVKSLASGAKQ